MEIDCVTSFIKFTLKTRWKVPECHSYSRTSSHCYPWTTCLDTKVHQIPIKFNKNAHPRHHKTLTKLLSPPSTSCAYSKHSSFSLNVFTPESCSTYYRGGRDRESEWVKSLSVHVTHIFLDGGGDFRFRDAYFFSNVWGGGGSLTSSRRRRVQHRRLQQLVVICLRSDV